MNVTNNDIIKFYAGKPAYLGEYANKYNQMRKQYEKCGKSIQSAHYLYNYFKRSTQNGNIGNKNNPKFYEYVCNEEKRREEKRNEIIFRT